MIQAVVTRCIPIGNCDSKASAGIPHGVFLVKRPKLGNTTDGGDIRSIEGISPSPVSLHAQFCGVTSSKKYV